MESIFKIKTYRKYDKNLICALTFTFIIFLYHLTLLILEYLILYNYSQQKFTDCIYPKTFYMFYIFLFFQLSYFFADINVW